MPHRRAGPEEEATWYDLKPAEAKLVGLAATLHHPGSQMPLECRSRLEEEEETPDSANTMIEVAVPTLHQVHTRIAARTAAALAAAALACSPSDFDALEAEPSTRASYCACDEG